MAAALEPIEAGCSKVTPAMIGAARSLGRSESGAAVAIYLPIARRPAGRRPDRLHRRAEGTARHPVPASLRLRNPGGAGPNYANDERLPQAGWPSLMIIVLALVGSS